MSSDEEQSTGNAPKLDKEKIKAEEFRRKTKQEVRKERELDEARKAGTAPAEVDEEGRDINPHIPQFIVKAPWYLGIEKPTLKHQKPHDEKQKQFVDIQSETVRRGIRTDQVVTKYRKGACENCGAMTHKKKDCLERPRKIGAKYSGQDFVNDEFLVPKMEKSFEGKRDRWTGYDTSRYHEVIADYEKLEMAKAKLKADKLEQDVEAAEANEEKGVSEGVKDKDAAGGDSSDDEFKVKDDQDFMTGTKWDAKQRMTVRNLRIREDTAKYLYNLDPNSAYYDPKARSMRENPFAIQGKDVSDVPYAGDNFVRYSGDATNISQAQLFAWEASQIGTNLHLQSEPTKLEMMKTQVDQKKKNLVDQRKDTILEKYGGEEHLEAVPKSLLLAQTETYTEYTADGTLVRGKEATVPKSIYPEDVYINNHTSVWGSFWREGQWGYGCCHSFLRNSYCTGEAGRLPPIEYNTQLTTTKKTDDKEDDGLKQKKKKKKKDKKEKKENEDGKKNDDEEEEEQTLEKALKKEEENQKAGEKILLMDERKRKYNSMHESKMPTEMEMEAYRMKRQRADDPMANFL